MMQRFLGLGFGLLLFFSPLPLLAEPGAESKTPLTTPVVAPSAQPQQPPVSAKALESVKASKAMVVSACPIASQIGLEVIQKGGNAVDAAVTMGFVMAVTLPQAGNLGGGGFMMIALANGKTINLDYREKAPKAAHQDMFLDAEGNPDPNKSLRSHQAVGVPGTVRGLELALRRYGTISWQEAIAPALKLAEEGYLLSPEKAAAMAKWNEHLSRWPETKKIFTKDGKPYAAGERFIQKDLAQSLRLLSEKGPDVFYLGPIADQIVEEMQAHDGLISKDDLARYYPAARLPFVGEYRENEVYSMGPPSSGGIHIIQMLNILEGFPLSKFGHNSEKSIHVMTEAMKYAYADRSKYMGDLDFVKVPHKTLISQRHADHQYRLIKMGHATPSEKIKPTYIREFRESSQTTHLSIVDDKGNAVSNTTTLNFSYGTGIVAKGTGILLNNQMDDFSSKPGEPNAYGLIGGNANKIEPYKRMLSSMSPTIVKRHGKVVLVTGSPGGSRIITTVLQVLVNRMDHKLPLAEAVAAPRFHHQWQPDELWMEPGFDPAVMRELEKKGHQIKIVEPMGQAASIAIDPQTGVIEGMADPRQDGLAVGF